MVIAADVDGDGDLDILTASRLDNKIAWYENTDGEGNFGIQQIITNNAQNVSSVFYTDIDGDGIGDVVCDSSSNGFPSWFKHIDGQGTFGAEQEITNNTTGAIYTIAGDLDGDNDMDVLNVEFGGNTIAWFENLDGLGDFGPKQIISTSVNAPRVIYTSDLDGDGDIDVLSASQGDNKVAWYENLDGQGTFGNQQIISTSSDGPMSVYAADLDGDSYKDVMSASIVDYKIAWYKNQTYLGIEEATFSEVVLFPNPVNDILNIKNNTNFTIVSLQVYDVIGRLILEENQPSNQIDVSKLSSGLLFIQLETNKGVLIKKVLKE